MPDFHLQVDVFKKKKKKKRNENKQAKISSNKFKTTIPESQQMLTILI